jgi:hypothetical protein
MGIYSSLRDSLGEFYANYVQKSRLGRLVDSAGNAARGVLNFGNMSLEYMIYPQPKIVNQRDNDPDNHWPCLPDALTGNDPTHPNHPPRYPKV